MLNWLSNRRPPKPRARSTQLTLQRLESRDVPSSTVYVESNNPAAGQNAILAFHTDPTTGSLTTQFGTYQTGGTGELNLPKAVGPDDGDHQIVTSNDGRYLYAVNEGSNSITAFQILGNGGLNYIGTVNSGGIQPDGLTIVGEKLYVANRGDATSSQAGTVAPNITGFNIGWNGSPSAIANSTVDFPVGDYVTQVLANQYSNLLFVQVASLSGASDGNTVDPFEIQANGTLQAAPGGPQGASTSPSLQLGIALNPHLPIIYAGLTGSSEVGVYTYNATGQLTFMGAAADQGTAPCWCTVSANGQYLYVANTVTNSVGVYSLANPLKPVEIQEFALGGPTIGPSGTVETSDFQIALSPNGQTLYVIGQDTSSDGSFPNGNQLHSLTVSWNGTLSEPVGPVIFDTSDVPADAHPQGIAVVAGHGRSYWY